MAARKSSGGRKYGKAAGKRVESAMKRKKKGTLKSGRSGKKVTSRKQAIAIGLSEAREKGAKVPRKKTGKKSSSKKSSGRKSSSRKSSGRKSSGRKTSGRKSSRRK
jgi:uncharacterized protein DUF6496